MLKKITEKNEFVKSLEEHKGISTLTASNLIAEIIDIRRFAKDDNLASYAGLTKKEYSTGKSETMRYNANFNRRLKDALMTAARNFVIHNPDSHLTGYYKNLIKKGLSKTEAQKRVARALVRVIFKKLYSLVEETDEKEMIERGSNMANGQSQRNYLNSSNIPPLSINQT